MFLYRPGIFSALFIPGGRPTKHLKTKIIFFLFALNHLNFSNANKRKKIILIFRFFVGRAPGLPCRGLSKVIRWIETWC